MRRLLKFLHTIGSIGFMGSSATLLVLMAFLPPATDVEAYAGMRAAMAGVADYIFLPSLAAILLTGLLAVAARTAYQHAGWVWVKLASGILIFEGGLVSVHGPMRFEADLGAHALAGAADASLLGASIGSETATLWVMTALSVLNVWLGVYRPRFSRRTS